MLAMETAVLAGRESIAIPLEQLDQVNFQDINPDESLMSNFNLSGLGVKNLKLSQQSNLDLNHQPDSADDQKESPAKSKSIDLAEDQSNYFLNSLTS